MLGKIEDGIFVMPGNNKNEETTTKTTTTAAAPKWKRKRPKCLHFYLVIVLAAAATSTLYLYFYLFASGGGGINISAIMSTSPDASHAINEPHVHVNPYSPAALSSNPHLGWQPPLLNYSSSFTWRSCVKADPKDGGTSQPEGCRENPNEFGEAPIPIPNFVTDSGEEFWVPDVTMVRTMMMYGKDRNGTTFPPPLDDELCQTFDNDGTDIGEDADRQLLKEAMIRPTGYLNSTTVNIHQRFVSSSNNYGENPIGIDAIALPAPKLLCLVYTMANDHATRIRGIRDTWAGGCDGFLAFSTKSDPRLPAISIPHKGPEDYKNMWQKVRSIWRFVGTHYIDQFDWFHIRGDDMFLLPHNLKTYLTSLAHLDGADPRTKEYFVGRRFKSTIENEAFNTGGPGYTLSRATLRKFLANMDDAKNCNAHRTTSMEDVMISVCLRKLGIDFIDTRDIKG